MIQQSLVLLLILTLHKVSKSFQANIMTELATIRITSKLHRIQSNCHDICHCFQATNRYNSKQLSLFPSNLHELVSMLYDGQQFGTISTLPEANKSEIK
jgi:hypothetical protein